MLNYNIFLRLSHLLFAICSGRDACFLQILFCPDGKCDQHECARKQDKFIVIDVNFHLNIALLTSLILTHNISLYWSSSFIPLNA
jgi:hypothetical protein